jgi:hypothetical protein
MRARRNPGLGDQEPEADREWRRYYWPQPPGAPPPLSEDELMRRYGKPSWHALLDATWEDQLETERAIKKYNEMHPWAGRGPRS